MYIIYIAIIKVVKIKNAINNKNNKSHWSIPNIYKIPLGHHAGAALPENFKSYPPMATREE